MNEITINSNVVNTIKIDFVSKEKEAITGNLYVNKNFPTRLKIVKLSSSLIHVTFPALNKGTYKLEIKSASNVLNTDVTCLYSSNEHEQKYDHVNPTFETVTADTVNSVDITATNIDVTNLTSDEIISDNIESLTAKFGSETSYTEFKGDGTMKMYGNSTVFDDVTFDAIALQNLGVGISRNNTESCVEYLSSANSSDYMYVNAQLPHSRKIGTTIYPHIHFWQNQNAVPNFAIQYRWQNTGSSKTTGWTALKCNSLAFTYVSGTLNQIAYVNGGVTPSGDMLSDVFQWRIIRDTTNALGLGFGADPYTGTVQIVQCDIHVEKDDLGSAEQYAKTPITTTTTTVI